MYVRKRICDFSLEHIRTCVHTKRMKEKVYNQLCTHNKAFNVIMKLVIYLWSYTMKICIGVCKKDTQMFLCGSGLKVVANCTTVMLLVFFVNI